MSLATSQKHENTYKYCLRLLREFWDWIILEMFLLSFLGLLILLEIFLYFSASSQRDRLRISCFYFIAISSSNYF